MLETHKTHLAKWGTALLDYIFNASQKYFCELMSRWERIVFLYLFQSSIFFFKKVLRTEVKYKGCVSQTLSLETPDKILTLFIQNKGLEKAIFFGSYQPALIQVPFSMLLKIMGVSYLTRRLLWPISCSSLLMSFWEYQYFLNKLYYWRCKWLLIH